MRTDGTPGYFRLIQTLHGNYVIKSASEMREVQLHANWYSTINWRTPQKTLDKQRRRDAFHPCSVSSVFLFLCLSNVLFKLFCTSSAYLIPHRIRPCKTGFCGSSFHSLLDIGVYLVWAICTC